MNEDSIILLAGAGLLVYAFSKDLRQGVGDTAQGVGTIFKGAGEAASGVGYAVGGTGKAVSDIAGDVSGLSDDFFGLYEDFFETLRGGLAEWRKDRGNKGNKYDKDNTVWIDGSPYDDSKAGEKSVNPPAPYKRLVVRSDNMATALRTQGYNYGYQTLKGALYSNRIFGGDLLVARESKKGLSNVSVFGTPLQEKRKQKDNKTQATKKYTARTTTGRTVQTKTKIANKSPLNKEQLATARKFGLI